MSKLLLFLPFLFLGSPVQNTTTTTTEQANIQVALLLDTSNSMDGLIDQAKSQLWKMVNKLATTKKNGQIPNIEIALYEYGNDGLAEADGYLRQVTPLTTDLDLVSEELFNLRTNGGSEYCGNTILRAAEDLKWSPEANDFKLIIIAGNEPFTQGPVHYKDACRKAIGKGIMINTIFCGNYDEGVNSDWKDGADCADGKYLNINQDDKVVHISTPYDQKLIELNQDLNGTYIGYGSKGEENIARQSVQDSNAAEYGAANAATRATFKAKKAYKNSDWDLVDAMEEDEEVLESLEEEALPAEMKEMDSEERKAFVEEKAKEREKIRKEILDLEKQAEAFRSEKRAEMADDGTQTLDKVMMDAVEKQAKQKGFETKEN